MTLITKNYYTSLAYSDYPGVQINKVRITFYCTYCYCYRKSALESALSEKQDFILHLADCLAWLGQAEKHLRSQKPLGNDLGAISTQHDTHQVNTVHDEVRPCLHSYV